MGSDDRFSIGEKAFLAEAGRPMDMGLDGAIVLIYDGRRDTLTLSMRGHPNRLEYMLAAYIADHIKTLKEATGEDVTANALRNIFEMAKRLIAKDKGVDFGNN